MSNFFLTTPDGKKWSCIDHGTYFTYIGTYGEYSQKDFYLMYPHLIRLENQIGK